MARKYRRCLPLSLLPVAVVGQLLLWFPVATATTGAVPGLDGCRAQWIHPVAAEVVDGFRPPPSPYEAGNRGLEYGTDRGDEVIAVAAGTVTFAGPVGGRRFVVVTHPSGLRSTYAYLASVEARSGQAVAAGEELATADSGFHLTARDGKRYLDPLSLMAEGCRRVRLVPVPETGPKRLGRGRPRRSDV